MARFALLLAWPAWRLCLGQEVEGSIELTGRTFGSFEDLESGAEVRQLNAGAVQWIFQKGTGYTDRVRAAQVDSSGDIVIAGQTAGSFASYANVGLWDMVVMKLSSSGALLWSFQTGTNGADYAEAMQVDSSGSIVVAGHSTGSFDGHANVGNDDMVVVKFNSAGALQWIFQTGTMQRDHLQGVQVESSGDIVAAGHSLGSFEGFSNRGHWDMVVMKLSSSGALQWTFQTGTDWSDLSNAVQVESSGDIVVAGHSGGSFEGYANAGGYDVVVMKLNSSGALQWIYQTGTSGTDFVRDAQVASSGDIVIAGSSTGSFGGYTNAGEYDMLVMKLSSSGTLQWTFQTGTAGTDRLRAVQVESSGKILAAGHSQQSFQGHTSAGDYDMVVMELNSAGALQWSFQTGTTRADYALAMQVESSGDIVIAGETAGSFAGYTNAGEYDMVVMKIAKELGCLTCTTSETTTGSSTSSTSTASSSWTTMTLTPGSLQTIAAQLTEAVESLATHQAEFAKQMLETATDGLQREMQDAQGISMVSVAFEIAGGDVMLENENISVLLPAASLPRLGEVAVMSTAKVTGGSMLAKLIQAYNEATAAVQLAEPVSLHVSAAGQSFASAPLQLTMPITHGSELEEKACVAWDARLHAWTTHGVALSASDHYFATCSIWLPSPESPSGRRLQTLPPSLFGLIMPSNLPPAPAEEVPWALVLSLVAGFAAIVAGLGVWKLRKTLRARGSAVEPATGCCDTGERSQGGEQESGATSTQQGTEKTVKPQARLAMVSARFNSRNKEMEEKFRRVCRTLRERDLEVLMVQAGAGEDFARKTMGYLHRLQIENGVMLAVCTTDYAEMTESQYSSHAELQYALDNRIDILPLKVEDTYPPEPPWGEDHPFDKEGVARVLVRLAMRKSTVFVDCVGQAEDYIADEIERVLRPSSQLIRGRSGHGAKSESALAGESE